MQKIDQLQPILAVRQLKKAFHMHLVDGRIIEPFSDITFDVESGKLFIISGKSGAGKTSILKCIYRTYLTTSGEIWYSSRIFGRVNIATASEEVVVRLRERELGYCSQFLKVLPRVPAVDVTAEPLIRCGISPVDAQAEAAKWLKRLGIEESRWQASPVTFSGGEQQRLNLARAFIAAPRLLLLDEPTASLDARSKAIVLVRPNRLVKGGWLLIEDGHIARLGERATCPDPSKIKKSLDATAHFLMPGLIDLHSDAIEKLVEPRPNVHFALPVALEEADWRLAGCGITTEFHAISLDDNEFGVRSDSFIRELYEAIMTAADTLLVRHKIHARLELSSQRGLNAIRQMVAQGTIGMVSIMDHSPGQGQYTTIEAYRAYMMRTTNRTETEVDAILAQKRNQAAEIPRRIEALTLLAREADLAIATHDDDTSDKVEQWPALGISLSEFPTTLEAAARAHEVGLAVCMGAPNALRGQSSGNNLSALDAIKAGIADVLCADYYPAAMLGAVFKLAADGLLSLPQATRLVTLNPAKAVGLGDDFGSLEPGKVADLIVVFLNDQGLPVVQRVFVDGIEKVTRNSSLIVC